MAANPYSPFGSAAAAASGRRAPRGQTYQDHSDPNLQKGKTDTADALSRAIQATLNNNALRNARNGRVAPAGVAAAAQAGMANIGQPTVQASAQQALNAALTPQVTAALQETLAGTGGTGGTATGGSTPGGGSALGTGQARTPFGQSFIPGAYEELWQNPEAMIDHYFRFRNLLGANGRSGTLATMMDHADNLGLLWMASMAGSPQFGDAAAYADWAGEYMDQLLTPGGKYMSPRDVMTAILDPHPDSAFNQQFNSSLLKPADQVENVLQAVRAGLEGSMPAPMLNAVLARLNDLGNNFIAMRMASGYDGGNSFTDWLHQQGITADMFGV